MLIVQIFSFLLVAPHNFGFSVIDTVKRIKRGRTKLK